MLHGACKDILGIEIINHVLKLWVLLGLMKDLMYCGFKHAAVFLLIVTRMKVLVT